MFLPPIFSFILYIYSKSTSLNLYAEVSQGSVNAVLIGINKASHVEVIHTVDYVSLPALMIWMLGTVGWAVRLWITLARGPQL